MPFFLTFHFHAPKQQRLTEGPFKRMAISSNGGFLALFTHNGHVQVVSTDFRKNLSDLDTKTSVPPYQFVWCGTNTVVLYWDRLVLMMGPKGDWIKYNYEEPIHLVPEPDGIRILSGEKCEFLHLVPDSSVNIFNIGSTAASALLFDAWEHFEVSLLFLFEFLQIPNTRTNPNTQTKNCIVEKIPQG